MIPLVKASLPRSIAFLIAAFAFGLVLVWRSQTNRLGKRWLTCLFLFYVVFSIPATARWVDVP